MVRPKSTIVNLWYLRAGYLIVVLWSGLSYAPASAQEFTAPEKNVTSEARPANPNRSDTVHNYPTRVFWGDTHLHTSQSLDAVMFGTRLGPEEAYRFARGEEVTTSTGQAAQLKKPLDFLVVADHAESYGAMAAVLAGDPELMKDSTLKRWHDLMNQGAEGG